MKKSNYWLKIDNAGKIFSAISSDKRPSIFRISMYLNEKIDKEILQTAVNEVLVKFEAYSVSIKKGFFWPYLINNKKYFYVEEETGNICSRLKKGKNEYLFRVSYFENRINLEVFHAISDGNSSLEFLKGIVYKYLQLKGYIFDHEDKIISEQSMSVSRNVDVFNEEYDRFKKKSIKEDKAYKLKGASFEGNFNLFAKLTLDTKQLLTLARDNNVTITQYVSALLMYSVYMSQPTAKKSKDPIKMMIPVNLRKYFNSDTLRNFSLYIKTSFKPSLKEYTFEEILLIVKQDFKNELVKEELFKRMNANVGFEKNIFVRIMPLFLKNIAFRIGYKLLSENISTCSISNLGILDLPTKMYDHIIDFDFAFTGKGLNMTLGTLKEKTNIIFTNKLIDLSVMNYFIKHLQSNNIEIVFSSNQGGDNNEKM